MLINLVATFFKYLIFLRDQQLNENWVYKKTFTFGVEFVENALSLIVKGLFCYILVTVFDSKFPFYVFRDIFVTCRTLFNKTANYYSYRRALSELNNRFPNATPEEIQNSDNRCVICREDMESGKKLPCGHIFHLKCIQDWLSQQQVCPTCRAEILNDDNNNRNEHDHQEEQAQPHEQQQPPQQQQQQVNPIEHQIPQPPPQIPQPPPNISQNISQNIPPSSSTHSVTPVTPQPNPLKFPPIPPLFPFFSPFPNNNSGLISPVPINSSKEDLEAYIEYLEEQVKITKRFRDKIHNVLFIIIIEA